MKRAQPWPASALAPARRDPLDGFVSAAEARAEIDSAFSIDTAPTWIPTISGVKVDLLAPKVDMIRIGDIAAALAKVNRWTGHTALPYSVAQHSVFVSRQCERHFAQYALLNDARAAYLGDISSTVKAAIRAFLPPAVTDAIKVLENLLDQAIFLRFGLAWPMPPHVAIAVKFADARALATEKRDVLGDSGAADNPAWAPVALPPPYADPIKPMKWDKAQDAFMARFTELFGGGYA
jgi:5'-nucleotidase